MASIDLISNPLSEWICNFWRMSSSSSTMSQNSGLSSPFFSGGYCPWQVKNCLSQKMNLARYCIARSATDMMTWQREQEEEVDGEVVGWCGNMSLWYLPYLLGEEEEEIQNVSECAPECITDFGGRTEEWEEAEVDAHEEMSKAFAPNSITPQ